MQGWRERPSKKNFFKDQKKLSVPDQKRLFRYQKKLFPDPKKNYCRKMLTFPRSGIAPAIKKHYFPIKKNLGGEPLRFLKKSQKCQQSQGSEGSWSRNAELSSLLDARRVLSTVTGIGGGRGRETQNCRHFWTRIGSSHLKSVNSHRDRSPPLFILIVLPSKLSFYTPPSSPSGHLFTHIKK